jgi:hypothetical protein
MPPVHGNRRLFAAWQGVPLDGEKSFQVYSCLFECGGVAQLARAFGSYPKGRGFDSLRRYIDPSIRNPCCFAAGVSFSYRLTQVVFPNRRSSRHHNSRCAVENCGLLGKPMEVQGTMRGSERLSCKGCGVSCLLSESFWNLPPDCDKLPDRFTL